MDVDVKSMENINDLKFEVNNNFFEKYNSTIRSIVTNILKPANQAQDIDDCVNTVFLCLMEKLWQFNETRGSMAAFVIMITRSTALDYRRSNTRKYNELVGEDKFDFVNDNLDFENEVEFQMLVENILARLTEKESVLFTMKFVLFDPADEIAKTFNISKHTLEMRANRLKKKIKKFLTKGGIVL